MKKINPPQWCPEAIASDQGWHDPKSGELLVAYRGLKTLLELIPAESILDETISEEVLDENLKDEKVFQDKETKANLKEVSNKPKKKGK